MKLSTPLGGRPELAAAAAALVTRIKGGDASYLSEINTWFDQR